MGFLLEGYGKDVVGMASQSSSLLRVGEVGQAGLLFRTGPLKLGVGKLFVAAGIILA